MRKAELADESARGKAPPRHLQGTCKPSASRVIGMCDRVSIVFSWYFGGVPLWGVRLSLRRPYRSPPDLEQRWLGG